MNEREELERAIASVEAQRDSLGDDVADAALEGLRKKLDEVGDLESHGDRSFAASPGERRIVTVLFCDVTGSTALAEKLDPEEWTRIMNTAFEHLTEPVNRYGGTVSRLMGDAILAFFGAPVAHEDDPLRAVGAGLAILESIRPFREALQRDRGLDFNVRVGINTGLAVLGAVGSEEHGEYTAMGNAVNLAARMEQTAQPGTVQISEHTYKLVSTTFEFEELRAVEFKGISKPMRSYRVLGRRTETGQVRGLAAHGVSSPLVGREAEFATAKDAVAGLLEGQGGILYIIGEAGIGKSRMMAELRRDIPRERLAWLEGRTLSLGQTISYWPFQEILWEFAGIGEEDRQASAWRKLESHVRDLFPEETAEILPYLASLLSLKVGGEYAERVKYLDSEAMGHQILVASRRFFERLAQTQPVVLVFEDLHWVDMSSARLIEHLLPLVNRVPLLVCGISRPAPSTPAAGIREIAAREYADRYSEITLAPLSQRDSGRLVHNLLEIDHLPPSVRKRLIRKADGNPFFLEEIIRDLIEAGAVVHDTATGRWWATAQVETITIPDSIRVVIMTRVDRLDEDVKGVLRVGAVIGRSFLYRVLQAVLEADSVLDKHLTDLQAAELIREKQHLPELEYIFKHALAHEATYEGMLLQQRKELHARVAQAVETLFTNRLEEVYGLLAYHYARAEAWEQAQDYLLKAGDQAGRVAADAEALAHYRRALKAYERAFGDRWEPLQRATLARKMGEAYYGLGRLTESRKYYQQALVLLKTPMPTSRLGLGVGLLGQVLRQALHRLWPALFVRRIPDKRTEAVRESILAFERLGVISYIEGDVIRSIYTFLRSLNLAEPVGPSPDLARAYANNTIAASLVPPLRSLADVYSRLALETASGEEDLAALAWVLQMTGIYSTGIGRWSAAFEAEERAAAINKRIGRLRWWEESRGTLALARHLHGDYVRSRELYREIYTSGHERGDRQIQVWGLTGRVESELRLGGEQHMDEAITFLERAKELLSEYQYPNRPDQIQVNSLIAQVRLRRGDWELASQAAEYTAELIAAEWAPSTFYTFEAYAGVPLVYLGLWAAQLRGQYSINEQGALKKTAWKACRNFHGYARVFPVAKPRAWLWQGVYDWQASKTRKAFKAWQKSLEYAERLDMLYDQGLAHYEIGRHMSADDPAQQERLERAVQIFSQLDAAWDLKQAQMAMEKKRVS